MSKLPADPREGPFQRPDLSRRLNRSRILLAIRRSAPMSRPDLERVTGLAAGTVQVIVDELLAEGLLKAARVPAAGTSGRGRPRLLLELNAQAALIAGVGVFPPDYMQFELVDLNARRIAALERSTPLPKTGAELAQAIVEGLVELVDRAGLGMTDLSGVGVGLPGLVESGSGVAHWAPGIIDQPYPLSQTLERRLGVSADVDNTANVIARAEYWFGEPREDDFAVILVGLGIGMGLYANGQLVAGPSGMAGEIGHMKMGVAAPVPCVCGAWDCVAAHAGQSSIVRQGLRLIDGSDEPPADWRLAMDRVLSRARQGDRGVMAILDHAGMILGAAVANVAHLVGSSRIVVEFQDGACAQLMEPELRRSFEGRTLPPVRERTSLVVRPGLASLSQGAAAFALERIYAGPSVKLP